MTYRKPQKPVPLKVKPTGWPHTETNPRRGIVIDKKNTHPYHPGRDVDETIEKMERWNHTQNAFFEKARAIGYVLVLVVVIGLIVAVVGLAHQADQEERAECVRAGGHVEEVHTTRDTGWVCIR